MDDESARNEYADLEAEGEPTDEVAPREGDEPAEDELAGDDIVNEGPSDVYLDVPVLDIEEIDLEVEDLSASVSLRAEVLDLLKLQVGADVDLGRVQLGIKGVEAQAQLKVRLGNVAAIVNRVLTTIDRNPEILEQLTRSAGMVVQEVGTGAGRAVGELGRGTGRAVEDVGRGAGETVENVAHGAGEAVEDLGHAARETVEDVGDRAGETVEQVGGTVGEAVEDIGETAGETVEDVGDTAGETAGGTAKKRVRREARAPEVSTRERRESGTRSSRTARRRTAHRRQAR
ncbi:hypothetical protein KQY30_30890 [Streptomyces sp. GMY02]|uniref:hypothetical protein n=1 Tax=Streptomyces sp. GMY02 TaxID=1333528 RepID=UPI001C2C3270|nr:hypothetical protein [Streptomyces sp. GMY02]QXE37982.1 hypothetical protein KQY30_30890 [Streptomyces sp. GMY02]